MRGRVCVECVECMRVYESESVCGVYESVWRVWSV